MTLDALKEEYKKSLDVNKMDSQDDYDQLIDEIDEAIDLKGFVDVVTMWANDYKKVGAPMIILERILEVKTLPEQSTKKIEDTLGNFISEDYENYPKIINALKKALKTKPDEMVDNIEYDAGDESEVRMESITMWQPLEYTLTVQNLCDAIGLK